MSTSVRIRIDYADEDVQQRVSRFLTSRHFPTFRNLVVDVEHGAVTLSGQVDSYYEKQVALNSCQRVAGVLALIDDIDVQLERVAERVDLISNPF